MGAGNDAENQNDQDQNNEEKQMQVKCLPIVLVIFFTMFLFGCESGLYIDGTVFYKYDGQKASGIPVVFSHDGRSSTEYTDSEGKFSVSYNDVFNVTVTIDVYGFNKIEKTFSVDAMDVKKYNESFNLDCYTTSIPHCHP